MVGILLTESDTLQTLISCQDRLAVGTISPDEDDLRYRPINRKLRSSILAIDLYKDALPMVQYTNPNRCAIRVLIALSVASIETITRRSSSFL